MTFKSGVEKVSLAALEKFKDINFADAKRLAHFKHYMDFEQVKAEHPELKKQDLCDILHIKYATIGRVEDEFDLESSYVYEGGTKSKPSNKSKNTKNTEETINNNDTNIVVNNNIPDNVPQIKQSPSKCYLCNKSCKGKLGLNTHFRMKHPTLSIDKDNINPKNIESLRAGRISIMQPNLLVENNKSVSINPPASKPVDQIIDEEISRLKRRMPSSIILSSSK